MDELHITEYQPQPQCDLATIWNGIY